MLKPQIFMSTFIEDFLKWIFKKEVSSSLKHDVMMSKVQHMFLRNIICISLRFFRRFRSLSLSAFLSISPSRPTWILRSEFHLVRHCGCKCVNNHHPPCEGHSSSSNAWFGKTWLFIQPSWMDTIHIVFSATIKNWRSKND